MTAAALLLALLMAGLAGLGWYRYRRIRSRLGEMMEVLSDIEAGHTRHKLLADPTEDAARLCFSLNRTVGRLNDQIAALERRDGEYKRLLTSLSHDLRTPLASLTGYLEALDGRYVPEERQTEYIGVARRKAEELRRRVDDLFDWFKLDAGELSFRFADEDLYELVRTVAADFIPLLDGAGMRCIAAIPGEELTVRLDTLACARMLGNLLQNALDHSGGDTVELSAGRDGDSAWVSVRDNGGGIDGGELPHIFDRLYKCDSARSNRGSGLGLSITRSLMEAHGGAVEAESLPGEGSVFTLRFPLT